MSKDTRTLHKADVVAKILAMRLQDCPYAVIREELKVSLSFIQSVLEDNRQPCANPKCNKDFYPQKKDQKFGSHDCYTEAVSSLGT